MVTAENLLRKVRLQPYLRGRGPVFYLLLWDEHNWHGNRRYLSYRLTMRERGRSVVLFEGSDFGPSPMWADDSDATVAGVMAFLTLRPGDTDDEYFRDYTPRQLGYCSMHAESLACEVANQFGEY